MCLSSAFVYNLTFLCLLNSDCLSPPDWLYLLKEMGSSRLECDML